MIATRCIGADRRHRKTVGWLALLCTACAAVACRPSTPSVTPAGPQEARLRVEVVPAGAAVRINEEQRGQTPLTLSLPPGAYSLRVEYSGYDSLQQVVELLPGEERLIADALKDVAAPQITWSEFTASVQAGQPITIHVRATDNQAVKRVRLWIDGQVVIETAGPSLEHVWATPQEAKGTHAIVVQAEDDAGNTSRDSRMVDVRAAATVLPSPTSNPPVSAEAEVGVYETTMTLLTYPYEPYLRERIDSRYGFQVKWLDRAAYEAAGPQPEPRTFKGVILENRYLKLTFLPQLGGRLYQCVFKPTGQNVFYRNAVLKPSYWGPFSREENWWLAAGGMEWALPVNEHGYEWGLPWTYTVVRRTHEVAITLRDSAARDRLYAEIEVVLPEDRASFMVRPRLVNPTSQAVPCQFWLNAALSLGTASISPNTEFVCPAERVIVHSTGDSELPSERQAMPWPIYNGRDLSRYENWHNWLGVFVPDVQQNYVGAYNHDTGLGIARIFPPEVAPGLKLFAFGANFPGRSEYSDDGSEYFEFWGGPCRTFWPEDDVVIPAGQSLQWSEMWLPFGGTGGLDRAGTEAVIKASVQDGRVHLGVAVSRAQLVQVSLQWNGQTFHQQRAHVAPDRTLLADVPLPDDTRLPGQLHILLRDEQGATLLECTKAIPA